MSLLEHHFDPNVGFLQLVSVKTLISRWKEEVDGKPERIGYLYKSKGSKDKQKQTKDKAEKNLKNRRHTESHITPASTSFEAVKSKKSSKRWFVLKGLFLAYFKGREESMPACVLPLDYFIVRLTDEGGKKSERMIVLEKAVPSFAKGILDDMVLTNDKDNDNELRLWFQSTNGKCANTALNRVFGMPLLHSLCHNAHGYVRRATLSPDDPLFELPPFLTQCTKYLITDGIDQEGIFRISPVASELQMYRDYFDTGVEIDLQGTNPHCVAGLIKCWLRELPDPIIPVDLYPQFIKAVSDTKDKELKVERVFGLVESLPLECLRVLAYIAFLAKAVVSHHFLNRMTNTAVSIVLGPCLMRPSLEEEGDSLNPLQQLRETPLVNEIAEIFFDHSERLTELVNKLADAQQQAKLAQNGGDKSPKLTEPVHLDLAAMVVTGKRQRRGSGSVIRSLNEDLPPLREGEIKIFSQGGSDVPTVTIEPSRSRTSSPKWNRKHSNTTKWKGGMVGGRRSGSTSPTQIDSAETERTTFEGRRGSFDQHLSVSNLNTALRERLEEATDHHHHEHKQNKTWSLPTSPDPEARMLMMIMTMQSTQEQLLQRVAQLEERLEQEVSRRSTLELRLLALTGEPIEPTRPLPLMAPGVPPSPRTALISEPDTFKPLSSIPE